jgi:hypothetical protein
MRNSALIHPLHLELETANEIDDYESAGLVSTGLGQVEPMPRLHFSQRKDTDR